MPMGLYLKEADGIAPANASFDVNAVSDQPGPFWISIDYWVHTADAGSPGSGFLIEVEYEDPSGTLRVIGNSVLDLTDPTAHNSDNNVKSLVRLSGSSIWRINTYAVGPASAALVSYRIMHFPTAAHTSW